MMNQQGRLRTRVAVFACVSAVALIADQLTKAWAMAALSDGQSIRVIPGLLSLTLVRNPGASLGMGSGATWLAWHSWYWAYARFPRSGPWHCPLPLPGPWAT